MTRSVESRIVEAGKGTVLIVEDDEAVAASLALLLRKAGHAPEHASSPAAALHRLAKGDVALALSDMNFSRATSGEEGLAFLAEVRARHPEVPVILMTAWGSIALAVDGMKAGAADFVTKPWTHEQLLSSVRTALELSGSAPPSGSALGREELDARYGFEALVGRDPLFLRVLELIGRVAATDAPVLVTGESGTGKELVAEALHRLSPRREKPLVRVNLGGVPPQLFESEMFGHVKGAFTDAQKDRAGRFEAAAGGTIFLDEIGELDPAAQVKLLRVLQDRTYEPLGSSATRSADVRVVSATNRDLAKAVEAGAFREDLLYRINLIAVELPPLRQRPSDVPLLARHFLALLAPRYGRPALQLSKGAEEWLAAQPWPGNVRQLRHLIERTVLVSGRDELLEADFRQAAGAAASSGASTSVSASAAPSGVAPAADEPRTLDDLERAAIEEALKRHEGNLSRVAEALGLSRGALYRRLAKYGITA